MSYDLYFRPRSGAIEPEAFLDYFRSRPRYNVEGTQAWYQNEDTGVYFVFELGAAAEDAEPGHPFSLNINFYRPSYFILEAEPEVTALVRHFGFLVSDPQAEGMGDGEYDPRLLISGWQHGNQFGYSAVLGDKERRPDVSSLPASRLHEVWRWNFNRESLQQTIGESQFVPKVMFLRLDDNVVTAAAWPDAIPSVLPKVDYLVIGRDDLAPRGMFRKKKDTVFVEWAEISPLIEKFKSMERDGAFDLNYAACPPDISNFVKTLVRSPPAASGISADQVLDRELVEMYAS